MSLLEDCLDELGFDAELRSGDSAMQELREFASQVRRKHGVQQTLTEQLNEALENEDFVRAAKIRDELRKRERRM
jgi:protein-arginine kinase activator protein McsA